ncbi:MAG: hypothetical protein ACK4MG_14270 [Aquabacterium sp.]|uniref:hypothetical protein n=1 Tax=uncultured Aquabacterium sp. TaxID=158753 RepID=UPI0025E8D7FA|nr:hypothetical protein [uncultured Aquabacterium sp.]
MSAMAHACLAAPRMDAQRKELDLRIQAEIAEAKRIQQQTGCAWTEALRLATLKP